MKVTAVLTVCNEGAFLLEWLAHHRAVGITDFLVFSNDCTDGTDAMLDRLAASGWLTHQRNPGPWRNGPHWQALNEASRHPLVTSADWLITCDIDEFINIHVGDRRLPSLLAALPHATAIPLTWRLFGNAGVVEYTDQPMTETFTRAAPEVLEWPLQALLFKTLFRNDGTYRKLGVHRPRDPNPDRLATQRWFDGSGLAMPALFHTRRLFSDPGRNTIRLAQLNHYAVGSVEGFILKCARGHRIAGFRKGTPIGSEYWATFNLCDVEDKSILGLDSGAILAELHADPHLGPMHRQAVTWRQERLQDLLADARWRTLFDQIVATPPSRALGRSEALARAQATQAE
ncbi:MAG: glycosyltransferase family 2 protein [Rhodobacterales bacterium]|nr:glycosyltransferase family 2 protein [Rhodobacterales bacterium]